MWDEIVNQQETDWSDWIGDQNCFRCDGPLLFCTAVSECIQVFGFVCLANEERL